MEAYENKKIILMVFLVAMILILLGVILALLSPNIKKLDNKEEQNETIENNSNKEELSPHLINTYEWQPQKEISNLTIDEKELSLPIEVSSLDSVISKYQISIVPENGYKYEQVETNSINDILKINGKKIDSNDTRRIFTYGENDKILQFYPELKNLSDQPLSIPELLNNNWWRWYTDVSPEEFFDLTGSTPLQALDNTFGAPSYIIFSNTIAEEIYKVGGVAPGQFNSGIENSGMSMISYALVYEYSDYTLIFSISDAIYEKNDTSFCNYVSFSYIPKEYWDLEKYPYMDENDVKYQTKIKK